jgi:hypothetical protein
VGRDTLSQNLGPLHRLQGCGGVDRQCDLEILRHSAKIVIKTSEMARHFGLVQCGHSAQAREGKCGAGVENTNLKWCMWGKQSSKRKFDLRPTMTSLPRKGSKTSKRGSSPTSTYEMD